MFRILILDDEPMALFSTVHSFPWDAYGFAQPETASDPFTALDMLRTRHFDAALIDIRMPGMNGIDLLNICNQEGISTICIMLSGYSDFNYVQSALRLRAFDYCTKPVLPDAAEEALTRLTPRLCARRAEMAPVILARLTDPDRIRALFSENDLAQPDDRLTMALLQQGSEPLYRSLHALRDCVALWTSEDRLLLLSAMEEEELLQRLRHTPCAKCCYTPALTLCGLSLPRQARLLEDALAPLEPGGLPLLVRSGDSSPAFLELLDYVDQHLVEELSLQGLAAQFHLNYTYCSELFRSTTGQTFTKYITSRRMKRAAELIVQTQQSINEIAHLTGYSNYNHFSSTFKTYYGLTPGAYRQEKGG